MITLKVMSKYKIAWLLSYLSIATVSATIITPALPAIQLQFSLSSEKVDWIVSIFLMGYVLGQLLYGPLATKWGSLRSLRIGLIINLIGILVLIIALNTNSYPLLILGRLISGLGTASGLACGFTLMNERLPEALRKSAIAYSIFSFTIGIGLAVTIGAYITEYWQWSDCFLVLLIHGFIMLIGTYVFDSINQDSRIINFSSLFNAYQKALSSQKLVVFSLATGFSTAITYCFSTAAPLIAYKILHISSAEYGYWNLLNVVGMLIGGFWSNHLMIQYSPSKVVTLGLILCALSISSFFLMWEFKIASVLWFFGSSAFLHLFGGLIFSGGSFIASNEIEDKAHGSSMMSFINMSSATLAVVIMPWISTNTLLAFSSVLAGMCLLIASLTLILTTE